MTNVCQSMEFGNALACGLAGRIWVVASMLREWRVFMAGSQGRTQSRCETICHLRTPLWWPDRACAFDINNDAAAGVDQIIGRTA